MCSGAELGIPLTLKSKSLQPWDRVNCPRSPDGVFSDSFRQSCEQSLCASLSPQSLGARPAFWETPERPWSRTSDLCGMTSMATA